MKYETQFSFDSTSNMASQKLCISYPLNAGIIAAVTKRPNKSRVVSHCLLLDIGYLKAIMQ